MRGVVSNHGAYHQKNSISQKTRHLLPLKSFGIICFGRLIQLVVVEIGEVLERAFVYHGGFSRFRWTV